MNSSILKSPPQVLVNLMTRDEYGGPDTDSGDPLPRHALDKGGVAIRVFYLRTVGHLAALIAGK